MSMSFSGMRGQILCCSASSMEAVATVTPIKATKSFLGEKEEPETRFNLNVNLEEFPVPRKGLKDFFQECRDLIRSDGGPPRCFSPLHVLRIVLSSSFCPVRAEAHAITFLIMSGINFVREKN